MVDANRAIELVTHTFTDLYGSTVDEDNCFGLKQNIQIIHPSYIMFANESSFSITQKKDGHVGRQMFVVGSGCTLQIVVSTSDHKLTLLPFTSATSKAICCIIIFQSKQEGVPATLTTGVENSVQPVLSEDGKEIVLEFNFGEGKHYSGGPKCKNVHCLTFASERGGITRKILVKVLEYFDGIDVFPLINDGPIPMLIVNSHQSRLHPQFVDYINDNGHKWKVCLGVPYASTLWQVGDASEQNGFVESEQYHEKAKLLVWKSEHSLPRAICHKMSCPL